MRFQSLAGSYEIAAVINCNNYDKSVSVFLRAYPITVAEVLREPEAVSPWHAAYNDNHALHAAHPFKRIKIAVSLLPCLRRQPLLRVRHMQPVILQIRHRHIADLPFFSRRNGRQSCQNEQEKYFTE